ncbi:AAA family ATPase [Ideonella sp. DXS29W]|uniref:AAA family ATPase n=1 Tax=Ideonella lacteola TaxID=2984193 RepID=A0ABU9BKN6_9BURK
MSDDAHRSTPPAAVALFELTTPSGEVVVTPLAFPDMAWVGHSAVSMAARMAKAVQAHLIDRGHYLQAVQSTLGWNLERHELTVDLPAGADRVAYSPRRATFTVFMSAGGDSARAIGCVPVLGVVALADATRLREAVIQAIILEHRRSGRLTDVRKQVAAAWFEQIEFKPASLDLEFHGVEALRRLQQRSDPLLDGVANELRGDNRAVVGLDEPLSMLRRSVEGVFSRSVLLLGAEGSGKTALLHHYAKDRLRRGLEAPWETNAARLIQGLTRDGGWQHALAVLCTELDKRELVLYVGHLSELFEVGQYQGNAVSLGEALREPLARGRLMLVAEATPSELASIESRSAGFAALFQTLRMPEFTPLEQERVMAAAVAAIADTHRVTVQPDAVAEVLALQRRFSPYSGFPGKGIRFFEELILHVRDQVPALGRDEAIDAFCAETGMPRRMVDSRLPLDLDDVAAFFRQRLFGQPEAIEVVTSLLATMKAGLSRSGQPIASLLLIGPTGVGKTEMAKALAEFMFGDARRMIRLDMSEYADPPSVLRLLGDLGQGEGVLIGAVRRQPFSVLLLDELEKAHPSFFDLLLQVLGEGRLTGGDGLTANFCGCFVVMTSNLGAEASMRVPIGLTRGQDDPRKHFERVVQDTLRPELFNRIDHIIPFAALTAAQRVPIFEREMGLMRRRDGLLERPLQLKLDDAVATRLSQVPGDARYGARDVQRTLRRELVLPLAHALAPHAYVAPLGVQVTPREDAGLQVQVVPSSSPVDSAPLTAADLLADARRLWTTVTDGPIFVNLVNQLFRLGRERQRHDKQRRSRPDMPHWDTTEPAARQRELLAVQQEARQLLQRIMDLEGQALAALAGEPVSLPDMGDWRQRFLAFQQRTFHAMRPESGLCTVGVYAAARLLPMLLEAWMALTRHAGLETRCRVVRLRQDPGQGHQAAAADAASDAAPGGPYVKFAWPQVEKAETTIVGYEFECRGPAVFDFLRQEAGVWRQFEGDRKSDIYVAIRPGGIDSFQTPGQVHRQHFFDALPVRRHLKDGHLVDVKTGLRCVFPDVHAWKRWLDVQFEALMGRMLIGDDE